MTASLNALRKKFPNTEIHAAVTSPWASLLQEQNSVDRIWPYERREERTARAKTIARLGFKLRKEKYNWVINFHASPSSALLAFSTGAPIRAIHFHGHKDKNRFSTVTIPGKGSVRPNIERDLDCIRALGINVPVGELPNLSIRKSETQMALAILEKENIRKPFLAIGVGASRLTKIWPVERFAQIATHWNQTTQGSVILVTGPDETMLRDQFLSKYSDGIYSAHAKPLRQLMGFLSHSQAYFGNDSGPKHMAVALGIPTITVIGPEDPFEWHPYSKSDHPYLFIPDMDCRSDALPGHPPWCGLNACTEKAHQCMMGIQVKEAWNKIKERVL